MILKNEILKLKNRIYKNPQIGVALVLVVLGFGYTGLKTYQAVQQSEKFARNPNYDPELRTTHWVDSANLFLKTGLILAIESPDGKIKALENLSPGDDCGHALFLSLFAKLKNKPAENKDLVEINFYLTALGIVALGIALFLIRLPVASILVLFYVSHKTIPGPLPGWDVYSAYIGVCCLTMVPVIWTWGRLWKNFSPKTDLILAFISFFCLTIGFFIRSPIAQIGPILSIPPLLFAFIKNFLMREKKARIFFFLGIILAPTLVRPLLLKFRDAHDHIEGAYRMNGHGIWQTLFHGLGTEPNPWGIDWADAYGHDLVKEIDPSVPYLSNDYQKIMRGLYLEKVFGEPLSVAKIYWSKAKKSFNLPLRIAGMKFYIGIGLWLFLNAILFLRFPGHRYQFYLSFILMAFLGFFLLQGVAGIPWVKHLYPGKIILLVAIYAGMDGIFRIIREKLKSFFPQFRS